MTYLHRAPGLAGAVVCVVLRQTGRLRDPERDTVIVATGDEAAAEELVAALNSRERAA